MKKLVLIACILFIAINAHAQFGKTSGGPDPYGYRYKTSDDTIAPASYSWVDITGVGTLVTGLGDDNYVGPFAITNNFQYYWYNPTQFYIGSNGFISFIIISPYSYFFFTQKLFL